MVARDTPAPRPPTAPAPGPDAPTGAMAALGLRRAAAALRDALARARKGRADGIHDARTLSRRIGALLSLFAAEVPADDRRRLKDALRALRRGTGPTRDLDALRELLAAGAPDVDPAGLAALREALTTRRRDARPLRSRALADRSVTGLVSSVRKAAMTAELAPSPPMRVVGLPRMATALERALARRAAVTGPLEAAPSDALHALRIGVKRARYAAEILAPSFGRPVARFATTARRLQDQMGRVLDAERAAAGVRALARMAAGDVRTRAAVRAAASTLAAANRVTAREARRGLDLCCDDMLSPTALRTLLVHLAKRAGTRASQG